MFSFPIVGFFAALGEELNIDYGEEFPIINCDETPIYFGMPDTTTIDIKGNKEVIIDTKGNILSMWNRADGVVVFDSNYDLKIDFHVCIPYTEQQKSAYKEIKRSILNLKKHF